MFFNIVKVHGPGVVFLTFHSNCPRCDSQLLVSCLEFLPLSVCKCALNYNYKLTICLRFFSENLSANALSASTSF